MQNDQSINVMSSGEWIRTLLSSKSKKSIKKSANVTALSGEPGYVPMPEAYDGLKQAISAIKNKKKIKEQTDALYEELAQQAKNEVDRYIEDVQ